MRLVRLRDRKDRDQLRLWGTACHEAGHAVAAYHFGYRFTKIDVLPEWDRLGCIHGVRPPSRSSPSVQAVEDYMVYLTAGAAAVRVCLPQYYSGSLGEEGRAFCWAELIYAGPEERSACFDRARDRAEALAVQYRPAIEALIMELLRRREFTSADARRLIVRALRPSAVTSSDSPPRAQLFRPVAEDAEGVVPLPLVTRGVAR